MEFDPLSLVEDAPLALTDAMLDELNGMLGNDHVPHLPGVNPQAEKLEANRAVDLVLRQLIDGLRQHPSKRWVLACFQSLLVTQQHRDTEYRDHLGMALENIMDVLRMESSDGLLGYYLGGL
ncbi:DUF4844 domain-containing protein [Mitsuaria sp. GD03876]|uniref:DUF4844 domain-containing protein n=1 Tax=Mitsuaria sp. GD03876 TaxID=2975399 RepID=UPI00244C0EAA|nr:DUF4844 domain-containing protein [Mitsuaria sp. GD03876]MDH0865159.1 DUF4844 domain-containing protein [Mitsuaria sp. GD03876]